MNKQSEETDNLLEPEHHKQEELCATRLLYRQGRKLTAVKVYTVNNESQHLFIYGVPKINLRYELKQLCSKYGTVKLIAPEIKFRTELFTECYHVKYERIQSARIAKRLLDTKSFYGGVLHVCYAPEFETIEETRSKLEHRQKDVMKRLKQNTEQLQAKSSTVESSSHVSEIQTDSQTQVNTQNETSYVSNISEPSYPSQNNLYIGGIRSNPLQHRKRKHPAISISKERLRNTDPNKIWKGIPEEIDPRINVKKGRNKIEINKHYTIETNSKTIQPTYGPNLPSDNSLLKSNTIVKNNKFVVKKQISENIKRIVFLNDKNKNRNIT